MRDNKRVRLLPLAGLMILAAVTTSLARERPKVDPEAIFETSDKCLACHNGMTTTAGDDASIGTRWRSTVMAHASKDPYWQASVRREVLEHPKARAAIEDKCGTCHMPMAHFIQRLAGKKGEVLTHVESGIIGKDTRLGALMEDGVSCSVCHQIKPDNFGKDESYGGAFLVDTHAPLDERRIFGPFDVAAPTVQVMRSATGFVPARADHIKRAELCATCHTLHTHTLDKDGREVATLAEQVPYLEWKHSEYRETQACQDCHMQTFSDPAPIASVLGKPRKGVVQHLFKGGNFFLLRLLDKHRLQLGVTALPSELEANRKTIMEHLRTSSASLTVDASAATLEGGQLGFGVLVESMAGHKLPTAYPSRRVWLHVTVKDDGGGVVFESGALNDDGSIRENDNDRDPLRYEPHYPEITSPRQVQIYEPILGDPQGKVTTGLLSAATYLKDNRVLPQGFDKATAGKDIAVAGAARQDPDFEAGQDRVAFRVKIGEAKGPFTVTAALWYQPIGYRWAMNLAGVQGAEPQRFIKMYRGMPGRETAVKLTEASAKITPTPAPAPAPTPEPAPTP